MPKVSILSPTFNHQKYIAAAIQSVFNQTFQDFELIITDDASTDSNVEEVAKFSDQRLTLLRNEQNEGTSAASTRCWQSSSGEYIITLATDDIYEPHLLETLVKYLDNHPEAIGVFALARFIDDEGEFLNDEWTNVGLGQNRFTHLRQLFKLQHPFCPVAGMFRRTALENRGYFPPYLRQTNDMAQFIRLLFSAEMPILPEYLLRYRWRANNANVSSRTPENDARLDFELFEILDLYREHINSIDLLLKIFPEAALHPWPLDEDLVAFHLAHVSISFNYTSHRLFGMHLLYQWLKEENSARQLKERCNFAYRDFFRLAGEYPLIMNKALRDNNEWLYCENASLKKTIEELAAELEKQRMVQANSGNYAYKLIRKVKNKLPMKFIKARLSIPSHDSQI